MRIGSLQRMLRYAQAVRTSVAASGDFPLEDEIPLPGLAHAQSQVAVPMLANDTLVGVIAIETEEPLAYSDADEQTLVVIRQLVGPALGLAQSEAAG